jgi:hypothetical protein
MSNRSRGEYDEAEGDTEHGDVIHEQMDVCKIHGDL